MNSVVNIHFVLTVTNIETYDRFNTESVLIQIVPRSAGSALCNFEFEVFGALYINYLKASRAILF